MKAYHLDISKAQLGNAQIALLPGDPGRVEVIAEAIAERSGVPFERLASKREFTTCSCEINGKRIVVTSTGIGAPSACIAIDELAKLGIRTFIRVGTTGAIQRRIRNGDCIITTGAVRLDGASTHYAPIEFPAIAHHEIVAALMEGAKMAGVRWHAGISASTDAFYPGEERKDSFQRRRLRRLCGLTDELRGLNVLNYEMESSAVLTLTASMGNGALKGGCITGVVNRGSTGRITSASLKAGEENAIKAAVCAVEYLTSGYGGKGK